MISEVGGMADVLIRDTPEAVLAMVDAHASKLGLSRVAYLTRTIEDRAVEVQRLLAGQGMHRAPSIPDVLIAAAELAGLTVLHLDKNFELVAGITGQPTERLEP